MELKPEIKLFLFKSLKWGSMLFGGLVIVWSFPDFTHMLLGVLIYVLGGLHGYLTRGLEERVDGSR